MTNMYQLTPMGPRDGAYDAHSTVASTQSIRQVRSSKADDHRFLWIALGTLGVAVAVNSRLIAVVVYRSRPTVCQIF